MHALTFKPNVVTFLFSPLIVSCMLISSPLKAESEPSLNLTTEQHSSLGLVTQTALQVTQFPSANFPAEAMIPLKTIRTLSSPLSGIMAALNVVHGPIEKGQILAEIDSPDLLLLQSDLLATVADFKVANSELKRAKQLGRSGVSSAKNLQQASAQVNKLSAVRAQQKRALLMAGMAEDSLNKLLSTQTLQSPTLQITSPIDGQLYDLQVRLGERVNQNQALFSLGETDPIVLVVRVPVSFSEQLKEGQTAMIPALNKQGIIEHIDPAVDSLTQSVDVHIKVENSAHTIRPGQLFELHFLMNVNDKDQQVLYQVPSNAISQFEGKTVVFIQVNNTIQPLEVTVKNITDQTLYFSVQQVPTEGLTLFVKGSTAIRSAFEAAASNKDKG